MNVKRDPSHPPMISVLLPVFNSERYLRASIESVLNQTFGDFEIIAIDNGSTDGTAPILDGLTDPRVRVIHQPNTGLAGTLNRGIELARGRYIARQDADDLSRPTRFEQQVAFMESHPDCALLGTRAAIWMGDQPSGRAHDHPVEDAALRFELLFNNPFVHSSVMLRKSAVEAAGGYSTDARRQPPEDYELWSRLARRHAVANLGDRLTIYREVPASISRQGRDPFVEKLVLISAENLAAALGMDEPSTDLRDIAALTHTSYRHLSGNPDLARMCSLVQAAARHIHLSAGGSDVLERAKLRIKALRHQYLLYRLNIGWHRPIARFARNLRARLIYKRQ